MELEFDDGTLLLRGATESVPYGEWDDRVDEYRAQAYRYRALLEWAGIWSDGDEQATLRDGFGQALEDTARNYLDLDLTPALHIEPRDYQQAALDAWIDHSRRGSVVLPTGSGKTFLGLQAIADAGVSTLVVTPTIDLMNQWHATLTNAFGDQLTEPIGVLGAEATTSTRSRLLPTTAPTATSTSTAISSGCSSSTRNTTYRPQPTSRSPR
jgi:superfamily II DNA or RNA helicase